MKPLLIILCLINLLTACGKQDKLGDRSKHYPASTLSTSGSQSIPGITKVLFIDNYLDILVDENPVKIFHHWQSPRALKNFAISNINKAKLSYKPKHGNYFIKIPDTQKTFRLSANKINESIVGAIIVTNSKGNELGVINLEDNSKNELILSKDLFKDGKLYLSHDRTYSNNFPVNDITEYINKNTYLLTYLDQDEQFSFSVSDKLSVEDALKSSAKEDIIERFYRSKELQKYNPFLALDTETIIFKIINSDSQDLKAKQQAGKRIYFLAYNKHQLSNQHEKHLSKKFTQNGETTKSINLSNITALKVDVTHSFSVYSAKLEKGKSFPGIINPCKYNYHDVTLSNANNKFNPYNDLIFILNNKEFSYNELQGIKFNNAKKMNLKIKLKKKLRHKFTIGASFPHYGSRADCQYLFSKKGGILSHSEVKTNPLQIKVKIDYQQI